MKYIKELREGENVIEHYLCKSRASMKSRNGKTYLSLKLQDKNRHCGCEGLGYE